MHTPHPRTQAHPTRTFFESFELPLLLQRSYILTRHLLAPSPHTYIFGLPLPDKSVPLLGAVPSGTGSSFF